MPRRPSRDAEALQPLVSSSPPEYPPSPPRSSLSGSRDDHLRSPPRPHSSKARIRLCRPWVIAILVALALVLLGASSFAGDARERLGWAPSGQGAEELVCDASLRDKYGRAGLLRSRLFEGTGRRVRKTLRKAREEKIKIGVLGGSVSACHAVRPTDEYPTGDPNAPECYAPRLLSWFNEAYPVPGGHELVNGAIGGMDSSYYAFCSLKHIPEDVDLVIIEFDANDAPVLRFAEYIDQLVRILLDLPNKPAVVLLGAFAPHVATGSGSADPAIVHVPVAAYYDLPYISMKRLLYSTYIQHPAALTSVFWVKDGLHPSAAGHEVLADLLADYFADTGCGLSETDEPESDDWADRSDFELDSEFPLKGLPPYAPPPISMFFPTEDLGIISPPRTPDYTVPPLVVPPPPKPFCASANDRANPLKPSAVDGWEPYSWQGEKNYYVSSTPGAVMRTDIVANEGKVAIYYLRSAKYDLGDAACWVDNAQQKAVRLPGYWSSSLNIPQVAYIDHGVDPGPHHVTCKILNETSHPSNSDAHQFRLVAVLAT